MKKKKKKKEGTCKVSETSVVFSAFYADFCLCPKLVIITTLVNPLNGWVISKLSLRISYIEPSPGQRRKGIGRLSIEETKRKQQSTDNPNSAFAVNQQAVAPCTPKRNAYKMRRLNSNFVEPDHTDS